MKRARDFWNTRSRTQALSAHMRMLKSIRISISAGGLDVLGTCPFEFELVRCSDVGPLLVSASVRIFSVVEVSEIKVISSKHI